MPYRLRRIGLRSRQGKRLALLVDGMVIGDNARRASRRRRLVA